MKELWATGFNAWGQLDFEEASESAPRDLKEFKCILKDESSIEVIHTTLSASLGTHTLFNPIFQDGTGMG